MDGDFYDRSAGIYCEFVWGVCVYQAAVVLEAVVGE